MVDYAIESLAVIYKSDEGLLVAVCYLLYHYLKNKQHVCSASVRSVACLAIRKLLISRLAGQPRPFPGVWLRFSFLF